MPHAAALWNVSACTRTASRPGESAIGTATGTSMHRSGWRRAWRTPNRAAPRSFSTPPPARACGSATTKSVISQDATSVSAGSWRARHLAAADGLHSPSSAGRSASSDRARVLVGGVFDGTCGPRRRRHYVEVHWARGAEVYVTPVADDCVGVAVLKSRRGGFESHLAEFPALRDRIEGRPHEPDRAAGPLRQRVSSRAAGRVLLVGDAAGYVDALTGEGLGLAFGAAELLVEAVVAECPDADDRQWRQMTRRYRMLTAALLQASALPPVRARIVPAAAAMPTVFTGVVNLLAQ